MSDMLNTNFWTDHRNRKAPKKLNREPRFIELPSYVVRQLIDHKNTFIHQSQHIEDVIFTLRSQHMMFCDYKYDGDNGYILNLLKY